ncbi:MAG: hypothetical protein JJ975_10535 [Bacteroidia bacterium]|nr:hypothetical protein [Bacteroidia bacterium]
MNRLNEYRSESYLDYLWKHRHQLKKSYKRNLDFYGFALMIGAIVGIVDQSVLFGTLIAGFFLVFLTFIMIPMSFFLPLTMGYQDYKRGRECVHQIAPEVMAFQLDVSVIAVLPPEPSIKELIVKPRVATLGPYRYEFADVFITKHSIFLLPWNIKAKPESRSSVSSYWPIVRFVREQKHIPGVQNMLVVTDYEIHQRGDDLALVFEDNWSEMNVSILLIDFRLGDV